MTSFASGANSNAITGLTFKETMFRGETSDINNNYYSQNSNFKTINKAQPTQMSFKDQEDDLVEKMKVVAPI